jgi:hypothetical protein
LTGQGKISAFAEIPEILPKPCNHRLEAYFITEHLNSWIYFPISDLEVLVSKGLEHFEHFDDPDLKCMLF